MSTKTIAVDAEVYRKLARVKAESESFSSVINRLVDRFSTAHTGADILSRIATIEPLTSDEANRMLDVVQEHRKSEPWLYHDLS